jgi:hypothetical protein
VLVCAEDVEVARELLLVDDVESAFAGDVDLEAEVDEWEDFGFA